jgi:septal ring factor EnvC (AmiA/AmiB activator)
MGTNGTVIALEPSFEQEILSKPGLERLAPDTARGEDFALAPLVDKIANGIARGLVEAIRELDHHIANETRKLGDTIERRLDTIQSSLLELTGFVADQRSINSAVEDQLQQLTAAGAELRESDTRQAADLAALQNETRTVSQSLSERTDSLCRELGIQEEDMAAVKATLSNFCTRADALAERLDRQADAVRSMHTAYSQRETELEQIVDGLARMRAYPTPLPSNGL